LVSLPASPNNPPCRHATSYKLWRRST